MGGGDKPLRVLAGRTLLERVAERLGPQCAGRLALSANGDPARFRPVFTGQILPDTVPDNPGPLAGLLAGLDAAAEMGVTHVASVPGDAPFLPIDFVARLSAAGNKPIALAASGERRHFTSALWKVALRDDLRTWLTAGERRVGGFIERHGADVVSWPVEPVDPFLNLNAPEDLAAAEALLAQTP